MVKKCPQCGGVIVWSTAILEEGHLVKAICSSNSKSSRVDWFPSKEDFCVWEGFVVREKNGVVYYSIDVRNRLIKL